MPIQVKNLFHLYGGGALGKAFALEDVGLTIENGDFLGIMGHTGCGKSTLIRLLAGLLVPTGGQVLVDGEDINDRSYDRSALRRKIGVVFQYPETQLFETSVEKDVAFGLKHFNLSREKREYRVKWALEAVGFDYEKVRKLSPMGLSGGEKRRAAIAGVLARRPKYLILDEPIAGLDPQGRESFLKLVTSLNAKGMTIVMVSHNADCLGEYANRILVLSGGRVAFDDNTKAVFSDIEKMRSLSIGVSQSREIAGALKKRGVDIPKDTTGYGELFRSLVAELKGPRE